MPAMDPQQEADPLLPSGMTAVSLSPVLHLLRVFVQGPLDTSSLLFTVCRAIIPARFPTRTDTQIPSTRWVSFPASEPSKLYLPFRVSIVTYKGSQVLLGGPSG